MGKRELNTNTSCCMHTLSSTYELVYYYSYSTSTLIHNMHTTSYSLALLLQ